MLLVLLRCAVGRGRKQGEQTLGFVDWRRVFVVTAVAEREGCRGRKVRGTVWLVGFGINRLAGCYGCEGAFCQDCLLLAGWVSLVAAAGLFGHGHGHTRLDFPL